MSAPAAILSILLVFSSPYFHATLITCSLRYFTVIIINYSMIHKTCNTYGINFSGRQKSISMHKALIFAVIDTIIRSLITISFKAIVMPICTTMKSIKQAVMSTKEPV